MPDAILAINANTETRDKWGKTPAFLSMEHRQEDDNLVMNNQNNYVNPDAQSSAICFANVHKLLGSQVLLRDICFEVKPGETMAIAGINGAGKTSLLRCLMDYVKVSRGSISIFGISNLQPKARTPLSFLPERFVPPSFMTGHETLQWLSGLRGMPWSMEQSVRGFAQFELDQQALHRPLRFFSKGMTQKIGLISCLLVETSIVVLDEPMSGLDPQAKRFVAQAIRRAKQAGRTVLFTSHSLSDVQSLCDRVLIIHGSAVRFLGTPSELRNTFKSESLEDSFLQCIECKELAHA
jgi:ABC-2 type transport system ATP-binding protein